MMSISEVPEGKNLRDLKELAKQVVQNFNEKFDASDRVIPKEFKENFRSRSHDLELF